jgi:hypothetical protein
MNMSNDYDGYMKILAVFWKMNVMMVIWKDLDCWRIEKVECGVKEDTRARWDYKVSYIQIGNSMEVGLLR